MTLRPFARPRFLAAFAAILAPMSLPAATYAVFNQDATRVAGVERTLFTASTVANAYNSLAAAGKPRPAANDLLQTLHAQGKVVWSLTGTHVRSGPPNPANLADAPGGTEGGNTVTPSQDTYGNANSRNHIVIALNDPAAPLGYDLTGLNLYILNIWSGAADFRNEYLLNLAYSTVKEPTTFIPLVGAYQRWEDADAKQGTLLQVTFKETVTGVKAIRLTDELGTDGTRWRNKDQATAFHELDVFGSATAATGTLVSIR